MSKKDKNQVVSEQTKEEKVQPETQESKLAKKIIDLEATINQKDKLIAEANQKTEDMKAKLNSMADTYKDLISQAEAKANEIIKRKIDETDAKFKASFAEAKKYAIKDQVLDLIDVINQFEIACNYKLTDEKLVNYQKGFKMFLSKFYKLLEDWHVIQIKPEIGQEFQPAIMECFETVKDPSKANNIICEVIHTGYKLYDHILKPALVKVIKNN